jgi:hypothetical protein
LKGLNVVLIEIIEQALGPMLITSLHLLTLVSIVSTDEE